MDLVRKFREGDDRIFAIFGVSGTLTRTIRGERNRVTGAAITDDTEQTQTVDIILGTRTVQADNGVETIIQTAETRVELKQGDILTVAGRSLRVTGVPDIQPSEIKGVTLSWRADCEGTSS